MSIWLLILIAWLGSNLFLVGYACVYVAIRERRCKHEHSGTSKDQH